MLTNLSVCDFTPKEEIDARIARFRDALSSKGIDYAIILQNVDLFYFTERAVETVEESLRLSCKSLIK